MIEAGQTVPEFILPATKTGEITSSALKGQYSIVFFYPNDNTPGCTQESCDFASLQSDFASLDAQIIGFNHNSLQSHEKFAAKFNLEYPLVADESLQTLKAFGVYGQKKFMGKEYLGIFRTTLIVGPDGRVLKVYANVKVKNHAATVLTDLKTLKEKK